MAVLIRALWGAFLMIAPSLVGRILLALGIGFVTYEGFNVGIDWLHSQIISNFASMDTDILSFLGWLWVDKAIGVLFSAYSAAIAVKLAGGTSITKMIFKKP
jgi:hypothetical protein